MNRPRLREIVFRPLEDEVCEAEAALVCEGVQPFGDKRLFAFRHADIAKGARYLLRRWRSTGHHSQRASEASVVESRHCQACARMLDSKTFWIVAEAEDERRGG